MSGIGGILQRDGAPCEKGVLQRMCDKLVHRGPDAHGTWSEGPVGLFHRMLHTTPESLFERQPLRDQDWDLCLAFDGRLDNREELRSVFAARGVVLNTGTDAEFVVRAYQVWGQDCPAQLLGDFAFALWDGQRRELFCARDILGIKPFYYYVDHNLFLFASEMSSLFEDERLSRAPNVRMVAQYLSLDIRDNEQTLNRGVLRLPAGHWIRVTSGAIDKRRYWQPDLRYTINYRNDDEYADQFLELLREAVSCRMRSHLPVLTELSGGVDSSAVTAVAHRVVADGGSPCPQLLSASMSFPGLPCDETIYSKSVAQRWGADWHTVEPCEVPHSYYRQASARYCDFPDYPNAGAMLASLNAYARDRGVRVVLTGVGGDEWVSGSAFCYADMLCRMRCFALLWHFAHDIDACVFDNSWSVKPLYEYALHPVLRWLMPEPVMRQLRKIRTRNSRSALLNEDFRRRAREDHEYREQKPAWGTFERTAIFMNMCTGMQALRHEISERSAVQFGLEKRHPLHDRRLIEFALALPAEQRWRGYTTRYAFRQAVNGLVPDTVLQRRGKADFTHSFKRALENFAGESGMRVPGIVGEGWVDATKFSCLYDDFLAVYSKQSGDYISQHWHLWMAVGIEAWYQTWICDSAPWPNSWSACLSS